MLTIPKDILQIIVDLLPNWDEKIRAKKISRRFNKIRIKAIGDSTKSAQKLTSKHIKQYPYLEFLNIRNNKNIKNISDLDNLKWLVCEDSVVNTINLKNLQRLYCGYCYNLDLINLDNLKVLKMDYIGEHFIKGIKHLDKLEELICFNLNIQDFHPLAKLKSLSVSSFGYGSSDITCLTNLKTLHLHQSSEHSKLIGLNTLTQLKDLSAVYYDIGDDDIKDLTNLEYLNITHNKYIKKTSHLIKLKVLYTNKLINQDEVKNLINLEILNISKECDFDLNNLAKLRVLISNKSLTQESIKNLTNLQLLRMSNNKNIVNIDHMTNLQMLTALNTNLIQITNINLTELHISGHNKIKNINSLINLKILHATDYCLEYEDIKDLTKLEELKIGNKKLIETPTNKLGHLVNLKDLEIGYKCSISLKVMKQLKNLKKFTMTTESYWSIKNYIEELKKILPNIKINTIIKDNKNTIY